MAPAGGARKPATINDVADLAGVSKSTVSNVLRRPEMVAVPTRDRVLGAIDRLAYRPNALARQLRHGRSTSIGIIVRDLRNPFLAEMASLIEREIARFGFAAMFCATEGAPDRERDAVDLMVENRVSGLAFLSYLERPEVIHDLIDGRLPAVFIGADEPWADSVTVDERRGGALAARHLLDMGHRRVAFVGPCLQDRADSLRLEGFRGVVTDAGIEPPVIRWDPPDGGVTVDGAGTSWRRLLGGEDALSGIFAANDFAAIDLIDAADSLGVRVPADLSIVGFDDIDIAGLQRISLTTIHQPRAELVRLGVDALMGRIDGRVVGAPRVILAGVSLTVRSSTGPLPARVASAIR
jgi:LacI family transcriptional regulator